MIVTDRLRLRTVVPDDADDLYALEQDPQVMRYLNGGRPTPRIPPQDPTLYRMPRGAESDVWAAHHRHTGQFMGWFALGQGDDRIGSLGYRLHRHAWGQGYGMEGAIALVDHGFRILGMAAIHADTMAVNLASRRIMEKLGMRHLRTYEEPSQEPIEGAEAGEVEYGITAQAWFDRRTLS
ncbi:MAG: GNAT family N-acetyltransferase [Caulobacter sp.]|nr:GNAT family N-acetyltransferase [Caulobacter sp.]